MLQDVKAGMAFAKHSETWFSRDVDVTERLQGVSLVYLVNHSFIGSSGFVWFILLLWKYILEMRLRREIIWHTFFYSISVSHIEIRVRVGKLVWLMMGKVGGLFSV